MHVLVSYLRGRFMGCDCNDSCFTHGDTEAYRGNVTSARTTEHENVSVHCALSTALLSTPHDYIKYK